jgi:hypothetical protein
MASGPKNASGLLANAAISNRLWQVPGVAKIDTVCGERLRHDHAIETVNCRRAGSPKIAAKS